MRSLTRTIWIALVLGVALQMGGCPVTSSEEVIDGGGGSQQQVRTEASVDVLTPSSDLSISGGTPIEVNWQAFGTTQFAVVNVFFDPDTTPDNGNEIAAETSLPLSDSQALLDTTNLARGAYNVGVAVVEVGEIVAYAYAPGAVIVDQRADLSFTSDDARTNYVFDRTQRIVVPLEVAWQVADPDSSKQVSIYLDSDSSPNGNEILLYTADAVPAGTGYTTGSFTFDFPPASFEVGTYQFVAFVSDGTNTVTFYAPGSIRLRNRLAGYIDLRDLGLPEFPYRGGVFEGVNPRDNAGSLVTRILDIDGDGYDEIMIVAQHGKPQYVLNAQRLGIGEAYLIYGRSDPFTGVNNLNSTGVLFRGEIYGGVPEVGNPIRPSRGLKSFTTVSDWDGDGRPEFAFGVPFTDSARATSLDQAGYFRSGGAIVIATSSLTSFGGHRYYRLHQFGYGWSGELTCPDPAPTCPEGFIGPKAPDWLCYAGYTLFYSHLGATVDPYYLGARISTAEFGDQCGDALSAYPYYAVNGVPDPNASPDMSALVISCPNRDPSDCTFSAPSIPGGGAVSVYFPGTNIWDTTDTILPKGGPFAYVLDDTRIDSATGLDMSPGYYTDPDGSEPCDQVFEIGTPEPSSTTRFYGGVDGAAAGNAVGIEDFNTDGLPDLLIGTPWRNDGAGACFIVFGRIQPLFEGIEFDLEELTLPMVADTTERAFDGLRIVGGAGDRLGLSQDTAGDFNGDGIGDIVIGSPYVNNDKGGVAVFYGSRDVINLTTDEIAFDQIDDLGLGVIFEGEEAGDMAGARVVSVSDVDGDGLDDILIAAPERSVKLDINLDGVIDIDRYQCGVVYLIYGSPNLSGTLSLADVGTEMLPGVVFIGRNAGDQLGAGIGESAERSEGIASAGDFDGDGFSDLLLGSVNASPGDLAHAGEVYVIYGMGD